MRVLRFDDEISARLKSMGLEIAKDGESATLTGEMTITIIQPAKNKFSMETTLPNGSYFFARMIELEEPES